MPLFTALTSAGIAVKAAAVFAGAAAIGGGLTVAAGVTETTLPDVEVEEKLADAAERGTDAALEAEEAGERRAVPDLADVGLVDPADLGKTGQYEAGQARSGDVHEALTDDEALTPGDEGFGQAVAERASKYGKDFGAAVAEAARAGAGAGAGEGEGEGAPETPVSPVVPAEQGRDTADEARVVPAVPAAPETAAEKSGDAIDEASVELPEQTENTTGPRDR